MTIGTAADILTGLPGYNKSYVDITAVYTDDIHMGYNQTSKTWMLEILNCLYQLNLLVRNHNSNKLGKQ